MLYKYIRIHGHIIMNWLPFIRGVEFWESMKSPKFRRQMHKEWATRGGGSVQKGLNRTKARSDLGWSSMQHILIEKHMIWQMANVSDSYFSYNMQIVIITRVISTSQDSTNNWKSVEVFLNGKTGDVTVMSGTHPTLHSRDGVKHFFLFQ